MIGRSLNDDFLLCSMLQSIERELQEVRLKKREKRLEAPVEKGAWEPATLNEQPREEVQSCVGSEIELAETRDSYYQLFDNSPVAHWERDFSEAKDYLHHLPVSTSADLKQYLSDHPQAVREYLAKVKVTNVNSAAIKLYKAADKKELLAGIDTVFTDDSFSGLIEQMVAIFAGEDCFEVELLVRDFKNRRMALLAKANALPGCKENLSRFLISELDVTTEKQAHKELMEYQKKLQFLANKLSEVAEQERKRLASYLHDHICQNLALANIKVKSVANTEEPDEFSQELEKISALIQNSINQTRSLLLELSPPVLNELGFVPALALTLAKWDKEHDFVVRFEDDGDEKPLDDNVEIMLFRAVNELLLNTAKHARARTVSVSVERVEDDILVTVKDDGTGFSLQEVDLFPYPGRGFGLFSIRERLRSAGGSLQIVSHKGMGSELTLRVPLRMKNTEQGETD